MLKEYFRKVLRFDADNMQTFIDRWLELVEESELKEFKSISPTFKSWRDEIVSGLLAEHSNGYIEGYNNKIKVIKRLSFGIIFIVKSQNFVCGLEKEEAYPFMNILPQMNIFYLPQHLTENKLNRYFLSSDAVLFCNCSKVLPSIVMV